MSFDKSNQYSTATSVPTIDEGLRQYMLKIYNLMAGGLAVTGIVAYMLMQSGAITLMFNQNGLTGLGWLAFIAPLIMVFAFSWAMIKGSTAQLTGIFWGYAAVMGFSLCPILYVYTGASIARVFFITASTFAGMSLYGYTTKKDLTAMGSFMMMGLWGVIIASVVNIFLKSSGLYFALSYMTVAIFVGLTAYDTQKIRQMYYRGDSSDSLTRKSLAAALSLYMDFINMFLALLRIMGDRR